MEHLKNIGPLSAAWLCEAGITSREELERLGAVMAFKIVKHHQPAATVHLLYALHAALLDVPWYELPPEEKARLKREAAGPLFVGSGEAPEA